MINIGDVFIFLFDSHWIDVVVISIDDDFIFLRDIVGGGEGKFLLFDFYERINYYE